MESRELYKQKYEAQMHKWGAKLDVLQADAELLTVDAKLEMKPHLDAFQTKLGLVRRKFESFATATDETWDTVAKEVDGTWKDLKAVAGGAYDALKQHKPSKG